FVFFFQAEDGIRDFHVTGVQTCALPISPDRATLRAVQTPQGFVRELLERAHRAGADRADDEARAVSDDAGLVELLGEEVHLVRGEPAALKITTAADLDLAERLLSRS